jgi:hypothetical protein
VNCFLGRVGVDGQLPAASFRLPLDAEAEEVEAMVDVADLGLRRREAQAHRGEDISCLVA